MLYLVDTSVERFVEIVASLVALVAASDEILVERLASPAALSTTSVERFVEIVASLAALIAASTKYLWKDWHLLQLCQLLQSKRFCGNSSIIGSSGSSSAERFEEIAALATASKKDLWKECKHLCSSVSYFSRKRAEETTPLATASVERFVERVASPAALSATSVERFVERVASPAILSTTSVERFEETTPLATAYDRKICGKIGISCSSVSYFKGNANKVLADTSVERFCERVASPAALSATSVERFEETTPLATASVERFVERVSSPATLAATSVERFEETTPLATASAD